MKKSIVAMFGIGVLLYPLICFSSYVIHLKDGREFATEQYYEEGDQIKFKRYGGVIGIQKDLVREIEVIEEVEELPAEKVSPKPETPVAEVEADKEEGTQKDKKTKEETTKIKEQRKAENGSKEKSGIEKGKEGTEYEKQKRALMYKYVETRKKLARAIMADDKLASETARSEMSKILKELSEVERKIKAEKGEKGKEVGSKKAEAGDVAQYEKEKSVLLDKYLKIRKRLEKAKDAEDAVAREVAEMEMSEILKKLSEVERKIRKAADTKKHD